MQKLAEVCIRRPVFAAMLVLSLVVVGAASYARLGVDRFPSVDLPTVSVRTELSGASAEEVESQVTREIEQVVNTVQGIRELRSISGPGQSIVIVEFELRRNIDVAAQDVREKVALAIRNLPRDAKAPIIAKFDNDQAPALTVAVAGDRPLRELTELADKIVKVQLERSFGVGEVRLVGGLNRAINIWVEADRLAAYQLPITAVRDALVRQNADMPGGNVTAGLRESSLRTIGRVADPKAFDDVVIATVTGAPIRVRDVGRAEDGTAEQRSVARLNGVPSVILEVRRQSGENTVAVIESAKASLARLAGQIPPDVRLEVIRDQSRYIYAALHEIKIHLILGSILASLVVLLFMRSWQSTIIAAVAIPCSVISAFGTMWVLGFTLNSVTMLALVLMVGIVIDDAIVVLENVFRFVEEKRMTPFEAAKAATADIGLAVMATTFSLVVIFLPVSFMSSISGRFLYQFGVTAAVSVLVSLLVSFTLTPMMSARMIRAGGAGGAGGAHGHAEAASRRGFYAWLDRGYAFTLRQSMRYRWAVVAIALATIAATWPIYGWVKQEYTPTDVDESEFEASINGPEGISMPAMDEAVRAITDEVGSVPGVRHVLITAGGGFLGRISQGNMYVRTAPHDDRTFGLARLWRETLKGDPLGAFRGNYSQREVMRQVRLKLRKFRDFRILVRNIPGFNIGGGSFDIDFVLRGPDLVSLSRYAEELRTRAIALGGIADPDTTLRLDRPELRVRIDRERAGDLRVDTEQIATALRLMVGGDTEVSRFRDPTSNEDYYVQLRLSEKDRGDLGTISRLFVSRQGGVTGPGSLVRLDNLVQIAPGFTASRIDRSDRQREVRLRAAVLPGFGQADRIAALRGAVAEMRLPPGYTTAISGRARELERTFTEFLWVFLLSVIFMYMILAAQFESLIHPLTILLSLPLSVPFALLSLWYTGNTLNLYSALGILVLFGVVKKNAILQIDHMNNLRAEGLSRPEAIMLGNRDRLRPILMTTLALVAAMLPLWAGTGPGAEERRAIAVVVVGGQTLSLLLTLLVTPVAYSIFEDLARALGRVPEFSRRGPVLRLRRWRRGTAERS
ncbi:MAG: efflux RND transporter permease subunit [Candidatus Rokubacteria bacterium]|nr:efflux RND transporter permease subunit [Candidatus Rokubacteria bacterium]